MPAQPTSAGSRRRVLVAGVERFVVTGGARLAGEVAVVGAKNSVLKLMAAALLAPGQTTLRNRARRSSTSTIMGELLRPARL